MAQRVTIPWGDGSGDNLYLDFSGQAGESVCTVTSDVNLSGFERTKVVEFRTTNSEIADASQIVVNLSIVQDTDRLIVATFNDITSIYEGKKAGY